VGAIKVHEFMTLDGVIDTPVWTMEYGFDPRMGQAIGGAMGGCQGILLGRNTYTMFEPAWSVRTAEDDPGAPFMNDTAKYVVSSTLRTGTWRNSTIVGAYDPATIRRIKSTVEGGIYVSGSGTLVRALLADGLVDELHLLVYPLTRGEGPRLFERDTPPGKWSLAACETYDNGVVYLNYRPALSNTAA
jgi:dihydrofolate reductase